MQQKFFPRELQALAQNIVFGQIIKLIPRTIFQQVVTRHDSIRAIERVFAYSNSQMRRLGIGIVGKSTLADASAVRPLAASLPWM